MHLNSSKQRHLGFITLSTNVDTWKSIMNLHLFWDSEFSKLHPQYIPNNNKHEFFPFFFSMIKQKIYKLFNIPYSILFFLFSAFFLSFSRPVCVEYCKERCDEYAYLSRLMVIPQRERREKRVGAEKDRGSCREKVWYALSDLNLSLDFLFVFFDCRLQKSSNWGQFANKRKCDSIFHGRRCVVHLGGIVKQEPHVCLVGKSDWGTAEFSGVVVVLLPLHFLFD